MLLIACPFCGPREQTEFSYGGEAEIKRPQAPETLSDEAWADYLFMRRNTRGVLTEWWCHSAGCRRWFTLQRDTVSYRIETSKSNTPNLARQD